MVTLNDFPSNWQSLKYLDLTLSDSGWSASEYVSEILRRNTYMECGKAVIWGLGCTIACKLWLRFSAEGSSQLFFISPWLFFIISPWHCVHYPHLVCIGNVTEHFAEISSYSSTTIMTLTVCVGSSGSGKRCSSCAIFFLTSIIITVFSFKATNTTHSHSSRQKHLPQCCAKVT